MTPLRILFVTPEVEPFVKVGGLADMVGALPKELAALGHDVRVVCPLYGNVKRLGVWEPLPEALGVDVGVTTQFARTWETRLPGANVPVCFLEHQQLFGRPGVYGEAGGSYDDNDLRYSFLCRAALTLCLQLGWMPDVTHCHDWTTGFVPVYLNTILRDSPLGEVGSIFTIHNLEHQGYADRRVLHYARLPQSEFRPDSLEALGAVNMMKAGLYHATKLTTVSPTYAAEIRTPGGGCGLDPVLRFRGGDLIGILNGIDATSWDPAHDHALPAPYHTGNLQGKAICKAALQTRLGLRVLPDLPIFGVVARLVHQKGLDLLAEAISRIVETMRVQIALLGTGEPALEQAFRQAAQRFPGRVGVHLGFSGELARLIQAGSDFFIMPSRAEPCGLTQMYAMRYGAPPIVRATGGLIDTVAQYDEATGQGTGFLFEDATPAALHDTVGWACSTYYDRPLHYRSLQQNGMRRDFGWSVSARHYVDVYRWAINQRRGASAPTTPVRL